MKRYIFLLLPALSMMFVACEKQEKKNDNKPGQVSLMEDEEGEDYESAAPTDRAISDSDKNLIQKIRQSIQNDNTVNPSTKNLSITAKDGNITLIGSVNTDREKTAIASKVRQVSGVRTVDNQLEVASTQGMFQSQGQGRY